MEVFKCAFSLLLFAFYYYLFARRYVDKYRQGGVIKTEHEEKPAHPVPCDPKYQKSMPKESINAECLDRVWRVLGHAQVKLGMGRF